MSLVGVHFDIQLGKMLDAAHNAGDLKPYLGNKAVQWDRIDIAAAGLVPLTRMDQMRYLLTTNDLLVCEGGEVGRAAIWRDELDECYYQKALHRLRAKAGFDPRVMRALLEYWADTRAFDAFVTQTSIAHLPRVKLLTMPLPAIPLDEQKRIGAVLDDANQLIAVLEDHIAKSNAIKQGMMQQLLTGETRLPGHDGIWIDGPLEQFVPLQRGFDLPTPQVKPGPYPVVYSNGVARRHAVAMAPGPGVVTGRSGTIGKVHYIPGSYWPHNTALWVTNFARTDTKFVYYFLANLGLQRFASGSGVPTLNRNDAHAFWVHLPEDIDEQRAIAAVLTNIDDDIDALQRRLSKAKFLKRGMMHELLTGRIRLPVTKGAAT